MNVMNEEKPARRSVSRKFYQQLQTELQNWKQNGTITSEQTDAILAQYVVVSPLYGRLIVILVTLGAILAGAGVIIFVSANWQEIPRIAKLVMLLVLVAGAYYAGYWLKYRRNFPRAGGAIIFVGAMIFGAALFLVGQQYHMPVDDPKLLGWWFIGVIPVAYLTRSKAILTLAILAALGGLGYKTGHWFHGMSDPQFAFFAFYLVLGAVLYSIGSVHSRFPRLKYYTPRYQIFGLILVLLVMYIMSFKDIYSDYTLTQWDLTKLPAAFVITFHIAAGIAIAGAIWSLALDIKRKQVAGRLTSDLAGIIIIAIISYVGLFLPFQSRAPYIIVFNIVLFAGILGLIFLGYFQGVGWLVNIALVFFGLFVIGRYFDLTWNLLPRSAFFIVGGLLLLGIGILLERLRRKTLRQMHAIEVTDENES
jgi:uncharacterized membrane protein